MIKKIINIKIIFKNIKNILGFEIFFINGF